jgi:hypothetical protein
MAKGTRQLISVRGEFWSRNKDNFLVIKRDYQNPFGIYALYNGLTPVYFGHGRIASRLRNHDKSGFRSGYWDHFSWYKVEKKGILRDLEVLLLRMLPVYLHMLNRQRGSFLDCEKAKPGHNHKCELKRPKYGAGAKHNRRRR